MQITEDTIRGLCTAAVYERGETYLSEGRIQQLTRFDELVTTAIDIRTQPGRKRGSGVWLYGHVSFGRSTVCGRLCDRLHSLG